MTALDPRPAAPVSSPAGAPMLRLSGLLKQFRQTVAVDHCDLAVQPGEFVALLGPSGCGKTTMLRLIAGFEQADSGTIELDGQTIVGPATFMPPERRRIGMVFQEYALFPHMSVGKNVGYGVPRGADRDRRIDEALALVDLEGYRDRMPHQLSGGQQQRVALARAIAVEPDVLLFDEALSALDRKLREEMQVELRRLLQEVKATAIFVTHDQDEALTMSDRVAVMNKGRIEQLAEPRELYLRPASLFALNFVGLSTRISGTVLASDDGKVAVETKLGRLSALGTFKPGSSVIVAARPEQLRVGDRSDENSAAGRVRSVVFQGSRTLVDVDAGAGESLLAELSGRNGVIPRVHEEIHLSWPITETFAFPAEAQA
jgi:putative spermidine/putrescine transport system ATP-binding protein